MPDRPPVPAQRAVFLSYASQDAEAVERIAVALRAAGVEVWFDRNELVGGDAWDQKIRGQLASCALFVPVVSAATQARREGYFRLEWKLADERTHLMAEGTPFLLPVVIDETRDREALVPKSFLGVQWTRLPGGETPPAFCARVKKLLGGEGAPVSDRRSEAAEKSTNPGQRPVLPTNQPSRPWLAPAILGAAAVAALALWQPWRAKEKPAPPASAAASPPSMPATTPAASPTPAFDSKSIAVMAFKNLSSEKDSEYFSDGLSDNISVKIGQNPAFHVVGSTSSFFYKGKSVPFPQIAQELHVGTIIDGSVQRAGNKLRVVVQLINAADGMHVWSETYTKELTTADIFAIQDEIAQKIAARLAPAEVLSAPALASAAPTQNLAAYDAYLRGRSFQTRSSAFRNDAIREYQRAVALDPQFALAWAQLACTIPVVHLSSLTAADLTLAKRAMDEARQLAGDFFETHLAAALWYRWQFQYDLAEPELARAERLRPRTGEVLNLRGGMEMSQGRWDEGISHLRQATQLDPQNGYFQGVLGTSLRSVGRYAEAEQTLDRASGLTAADNHLSQKALVYFLWKGDATLVVKALDAVPLGVRSDSYWSYRWRLLRDVGDYMGALAAVEHIRAENAASGVAFGGSKALLIALARESQGDREGARRAYAEALPMAERSHAETPQGLGQALVLARTYAGLGQKEKALATAAASLELAHGIPFYVMQVDAVRAQIAAHFGMIAEALYLAKTQIPTGWWKRNELLLGADWAELRKDPRFRTLAEKAPL
jgi:TolB-like protein